MSTLGSGRDKDAELALAIAAERARATSELGQALRSYVYPVAALLGLIVLWQLGTAVFAIPLFILPSPTQIVREIVDKAPLLAEHGLVTLSEILIGFCVSVLVGVPLAVAMTYSPALERVLYPLLVGSQTIPKVALAPLFIVWLGFGLAPKILMTFMISFFPIVIGAAIGLATIELELLYLARSMGASGWQIFWKVRLPYALPSLFGGLKVGITLAVVGAVVGEFVGADKGLGYLIQLANGRVDTPLLLAAVVMMSATGIVLYLVVERLEPLLRRAFA